MGPSCRVCWGWWVSDRRSKFVLHSKTLKLRHNEHSGVSNHRRLDCLFNRFFRLMPKKTSKPALLALCEGTGGFPSQWASNAESVSIWWCRHEQGLNERISSNTVRIHQNYWNYPSSQNVTKSIQKLLLKIYKRRVHLTLFLECTWISMTLWRCYQALYRDLVLVMNAIQSLVNLIAFRKTHIF